MDLLRSKNQKHLNKLSDNILILKCLPCIWINSKVRQAFDCSGEKILWIKLSDDMDDTKKVSNYPQSEIDRAQNAVKMSAKIWLLLLCHILRWIIQFSMHNTPAGFVLLLLDFLHIQYIPLEQTDMSHLTNNDKLKWFALKFSDHYCSVIKSF